MSSDRAFESILSQNYSHLFNTDNGSYKIFMCSDTFMCFDIFEWLYLSQK